MKKPRPEKKKIIKTKMFGNWNRMGEQSAA